MSRRNKLCRCGVFDATKWLCRCSVNVASLATTPRCHSRSGWCYKTVVPLLCECCIFSHYATVPQQEWLSVHISVESQPYRAAWTLSTEQV
ncbi:hypothetical protein J6590_091568 [Homalodisca vitripennis]|nr:hypothetical protein J6590_091568 [Homalodisca vitripennis]